MMMRHASTLAAAALLSFAACKGEPAPEQAPASVAEVSRADFNRIAPELALPLFWAHDADKDGALDAAELGVFWGLEDSRRDEWVEGPRFTQQFVKAYARITERAKAKAAAPNDPRHEALAKEVAGGYFTLVESDFTAGTPEDKAIVGHIMKAAAIVERVYQKQLGSWGMAQKIPADDTLARLVFFINQSPWCSAPGVESDQNCSAVAPRPENLSGLYPHKLQADKAFCDKLAKAPEAEALTRPFTAVVEGEGGALKAVPYTELYKEELTAVAQELRAAAGAIQSPSEAAFKTYLEAAAQAFTDNEWFKADEAWAKMNAENSKWYLRIGPDEVYFEPCSLKAGFHVSFARINPGSLEWQKKLEPVKAEMEQALAQKAGAPYKAREVSFHLPDFIDVVLNAGDSRDARGATIGQSLPNWGPVANEGRGRTVVMTNFYTDTDSKQIIRSQVESVMCKASMQKFVEEQEPMLMSTVLHEAAHNLGPAHEYKVSGKTDDQVFGGPMASTLEELKAQTAALYFTDWLAEKGLATRELAEQAHVRDVTWAFGHISRGLYDAEGKPKPYSQLAAIQVGFLMKEGAISWKAEEVAANGSDKGCFELDLSRFPPAIDKLTGVVLAIKGKGDVAGANALKQKFVDDEGEWKRLVGILGERYLRWPRASFLYSVKL